MGTDIHRTRDGVRAAISDVAIVKAKSKQKSKGSSNSKPPGSVYTKHKQNFASSEI